MPLYEYYCDTCQLVAGIELPIEERNSYENSSCISKCNGHLHRVISMPFINHRSFRTPQEKQATQLAWSQKMYDKKGLKDEARKNIKKQIEHAFRTEKK